MCSCSYQYSIKYMAVYGITSQNAIVCRRTTNIRRVSNDILDGILSSSRQTQTDRNETHNHHYQEQQQLGRSNSPIDVLHQADENLHIASIV